MITPEKQLLITFDRITVHKFSMTAPEDSSKKLDDLDVSIGYSPFFNDENGHEIKVKFHIRVFNQDNTFIFECLSTGYFQSSEQLGPEFKTSDWGKVNAPAIAFPFIRAFISTVTLNAGYSPVILPSYNFTKFKASNAALPDGN